MSFYSSYGCYSCCQLWWWELVVMREMKGESREAKFLHCHLLTQGNREETMGVKEGG